MNLLKLIVLAEAAGVDTGRLFKPFRKDIPRQLTQADFDALEKAKAKRAMRVAKRKSQ